MNTQDLDKLVTKYGPITIQVEETPHPHFRATSKQFSLPGDTAFDALAAVADMHARPPLSPSVPPTSSDRLNNMPATIQMADLTYRLVQPFVLHPDGRSEGPYYRREGDASLRLYVPEPAYLAGLIDNPTAMYHVD